MNTTTLDQSISAETWATFRRQLVAFVARRVDQPEVAEDITQGVLERLARTGPSTIDNPQAWLHRSARNAIVDHYRSRRADDSLDADVVAEPAGDMLLHNPEHELAQCLLPLVDELPDHYRRALQLVDLGGQTQAAAADQENVSVSGMKSRVQRGRRRLAALLTGCCRVTLNADRSIDDYVPTGQCNCSSTS
jgi:RNA polymerase sigma-70 factor (ECF subfamily)